MIASKLNLINEQTSPLFRIMWVHNVDEPARKQFDNNICAFHIGGGFIMSVAHNLRAESQIFKSLDEVSFQNEILANLNDDQKILFNQSFLLDTATNKRYINIIDQNNVLPVIDALKQINFDTRWITLHEKNICQPFLIVQFEGNQFYNDDGLTSHFAGNRSFHEPSLNRYTFLIELELVEAFYSSDIALYKIINIDQEVIHQLPSIDIEYKIIDDDELSFYCLQNSPGGTNLGRLLNTAVIEGFLDHHGLFADRIGGNYTSEGLRYLIKGYFRFGSSGAPYVVFDNETDRFKVNAIQSEASPIQLAINNDRNGNFQYINAIATPLNLIQERLLHHIEA